MEIIVRKSLPPTERGAIYRRKAPMNFKNLGQQLLHRWLREQKIQVQELARMLKIPASPLYLYSSGHTTPGLRRAAWIEQITGIPAVAWICTLSEAENSAD